MSVLTRENLFYLIKELIWQALTIMACYAILYPITQKLTFLHFNMYFVFIYITLTYFRWTVLFSNLPFLHPAWVRFILFSVNLSLFILLMQQEQRFMSLFENSYIEDFGFPKVILYEGIKQQLFKYIYSIIVLFGTGSLIMISIFNLRLIVSWWQLYKYKASALLED